MTGFCVTPSVSAAEIGVATGEPLYVVHLDAANARVIVGPAEALQTRRIVLRDVNWLGDLPLQASAPEGIELYAKIRSTRPPKPALLYHRDGETTVELTGGESGVCAGAGLRFLHRCR